MKYTLEQLQEMALDFLYLDGLGNVQADWFLSVYCAQMQISRDDVRWLAREILKA